MRRVSRWDRLTPTQKFTRLSTYNPEARDLLVVLMDALWQNTMIIPPSSPDASDRAQSRVTASALGRAWRPRRTEGA